MRVDPKTKEVTLTEIEYHELINHPKSKPVVDLKKLGEIARHIIAVKDHEEDMRLDKGEWLLLERIGYPEKFNAKKEK